MADLDVTVGKIVYRITRVFEIIRKFRNWFEILLTIRNPLLDHVVIKFRELDAAKPIRVSKRNFFFILDSLMSNTIKVSDDFFVHKDITIMYDQDPFEVILSKKWIGMPTLNFGQDISTWVETFVEAQYENGCDGLKSREVVDIGANVGDSAIFFALNGASRVFAYEPLPSVFRLGLSNIEILNLSDRIRFYNFAVGMNQTLVYVPSNLQRDSGGFSLIDVHYKNDTHNVHVRQITLGEAIKPCLDRFLLKIDCEGCEYDLVLNCYNEIRTFERLLIEYHAYLTGVSHHKLIRKLEADFEIYYINQAMQTRPRSLIGLIYCIRKSHDM